MIPSCGAVPRFKLPLKHLRVDRAEVSQILSDYFFLAYSQRLTSWSQAWSLNDLASRIPLKGWIRPGCAAAKRSLDEGYRRASEPPASPTGIASFDEPLRREPCWLEFVLKYLCAWLLSRIQFSTFQLQIFRFLSMSSLGHFLGLQSRNRDILMKCHGKSASSVCGRQRSGHRYRMLTAKIYFQQ